MYPQKILLKKQNVMFHFLTLRKVDKVWTSLRLTCWLCKKKHLVNIWAKTKNKSRTMFKTSCVFSILSQKKMKKTVEYSSCSFFFSLKQRLQQKAKLLSKKMYFPKSFEYENKKTCVIAPTNRKVAITFDETLF